MPLSHALGWRAGAMFCIPGDSDWSALCPVRTYKSVNDRSDKKAPQRQTLQPYTTQMPRFLNFLRTRKTQEVQGDLHRTNPNLSNSDPMSPPLPFATQSSRLDRGENELFPAQRQEARSPPPSARFPIYVGSPSRPSTSTPGQLYFAYPPPFAVPLSPSQPPLYSSPAPAARRPILQLPPPLPQAPYASPTMGGFNATSFGSRALVGRVLEWKVPIPPSTAKCHENDFRLLGGPGDVLPVDAMPPHLPKDMMEGMVANYHVVHPSQRGVLYFFTFPVAEKFMLKYSSWMEISVDWPVKMVCVVERAMLGGPPSVVALFADEDELAWTSPDHADKATYLVAQIRADGTIKTRYWQPRSAFVVQQQAEFQHAPPSTVD